MSQFVHLNFLLSALETHAKFQNPSSTTSGRKVTGSEINKKGERENTVNCGHYVLPATPKDQFLHVIAHNSSQSLQTFNPKAHINAGILQVIAAPGMARHFAHR